jgi:hypothetical protein
MRTRLPSPALVISCLALLLALGGTSYAAIEATGSAVNITDPVTASNKAKVDRAGRLRVNIAPTTPWSADRSLPVGAYVPLVGPRSTPINVTDLSVSLTGTATPTDFTGIVLQAWRVPASAPTCALTSFAGELWYLPRITAAAPFAVSFSTPLQLVPPAGKKVCLYARSLDGDARLNASGFVS